MVTSKETARLPWVPFVLPAHICPLPPTHQMIRPPPLHGGHGESIFLWQVGKRSKSRRDSYTTSLVAILATEFPQQGQTLLFLSVFIAVLSQSSQINDHRPTPRMSVTSIAIRVLLKKEMVVYRSARFWPKSPKINIRICSRCHTGCSYKDVWERAHSVVQGKSVAKPSRDLMTGSGLNEYITVQPGTLNLEVLENGLD